MFYTASPMGTTERARRRAWFLMPMAHCTALQDGGPKGAGHLPFGRTPERTVEKNGVYEFNSNTYGYGPAVSFFDSSGNLCGTTYSVPDSYSGSVFRLMPPTQKSKPWAMSFLYEFTGPPDGIGPSPYLVRDKSGDFYGTTQYGGSGTCGLAVAERFLS